MKLARPLIAFSPYRAEEVPGMISTRSISSSPGPKALPIGPDVRRLIVEPVHQLAESYIGGIGKAAGIDNFKA